MNRLSKSIIVFLSLLLSLTSFAQETWRGLDVKPENRCSPYDKKKQYPYPQSIEDKIVANMNGLVYGPYSGRYFNSDRETDIEHIIATSEAHDSGLCSAPAKVRVQLANDLLNLTLAAPEVNRCKGKGKCGLDAGEWMPEKNKCWFSMRVLEIKTKYGLSVDREEANALEAVLSSCDSFEMIYFPMAEQHLTTRITPTNETSATTALAKYDVNHNGKISCSEARSHGIAPVKRGDPAYEYMNDRDHDGVVCE